VVGLDLLFVLCWLLVDVCVCGYVIEDGEIIIGFVSVVIVVFDYVGYFVVGLVIIYVVGDDVDFEWLVVVMVCIVCEML